MTDWIPREFYTQCFVLFFKFWCRKTRWHSPNIFSYFKMILKFLTPTLQYFNFIDCTLNPNFLFQIAPSTYNLLLWRQWLTFYGVIIFQLFFLSIPFSAFALQAPTNTCMCLFSFTWYVVFTMRPSFCENEILYLVKNSRMLCPKWVYISEYNTLNLKSQKEKWLAYNIHSYL